MDSRVRQLYQIPRSSNPAISKEKPEVIHRFAEPLDLLKFFQMSKWLKWLNENHMKKGEI